MDMRQFLRGRGNDKIVHMDITDKYNSLYVPVFSNDPITKTAKVVCSMNDDGKFIYIMFSELDKLMDFMEGWHTAQPDSEWGGDVVSYTGQRINNFFMYIKQQCQNALVYINPKEKEDDKGFLIIEYVLDINHAANNPSVN